MAHAQRVQRDMVPVAEVRALNTTNRTIRATVIRNAQAKLNLKNQKSLRRQIRIPRGFRARRGKPWAGGLYDTIVPASTGVVGPRLTFRYGKADRTLDHTPFPATMKSGHKGLFVHAPSGHAKTTRPWRGEKPNRYRTQLPAWEVMVDATRLVDMDVNAALELGRVLFGKRFESELRRQLARA